MDANNGGLSRAFIFRRAEEFLIGNNLKMEGTSNIIIERRAGDC